MINVDPEILGMLIVKYGEDEQCRQAMGECGEFIAAAQNYYRAKKYGHRSETCEDMIEEAVDVYFMMMQMRYIDEEMFDEIAERKYKGIKKKAINCTCHPTSAHACDACKYLGRKFKNDVL